MRKALYFLQYLGFWVATRSVRLVPHRLATSIGELLGRALFSLPMPRRKRTLENLARALPDTSARERRRIARGCFGAWMRTVFEFGSVTRFDDEGILQLFDVEGLEHAERAHAAGRGVMLLGAHLSSMEISSYFLGLSGGEVHILGRPASNPWIAHEIAERRVRTRHIPVPRRRAAHRLARVLRAGGRAALAADQRVHPEQGVLIDFLGVPAWTSILPAYLACRQQSVLLPTTYEPLPRGRHKFTYHEPIFTTGGGREEALEHTISLSRLLEDVIRRRPEQWLWMHDRWLRCAIHRWPESLARIRAESLLPEPAPDATPPSLTPQLLVHLDFDTLESGGSVLVESDDADAASELLAAAGRSVVGRGHAVFYTDARELTQRLTAAAEPEQLAGEIRQLDRFDLLILGAFEAAVDSQEGQQALDALLQHRAGRRSILASAAAGSPAAARWHRALHDDTRRFELPSAG